MNTYIEEPQSPQFDTAAGNRFGLLTLLIVALLVGAGIGLFVRSNDDSRLAEIVQRTEKFEQAVARLERSHQELLEYLLSGDPRKADHVPEFQQQALTALQEIEKSSQVPELQQGIGTLVSGEQDWSKDFANPLIEARKQLDGGKGTLVDLQINFLQRDPDKWSRDFDSRLARAREQLLPSKD